MPSTGDFLDQHLKCFGENDADGVVADYSPDPLLLVPDRSLKGPAAKTNIHPTPSWSWADIEDDFSAEWEIGGPAMPVDAIHGLVADK